jgi:N-acetylmuramoyl-L-alanine amidase
MSYKFIKPEREIDRVFLHCSASSNKNHDDVSVIRGWHEERGWSDIGYHFFIKFDGTLQNGRDIERTPAAQRGHNVGTIAICLHGLKEEDFTEKQFETLRLLCRVIHLEIPLVTFHGHCEVAAKACPVFAYHDVLNLDEFGAGFVLDEEYEEPSSVEERLQALEDAVFNETLGLFGKPRR